MSSTTTTSTSKRSFMDGKKLWFVLSVVFALIAVVFVLLILRSITNTQNYYVLAKNVAARSVITDADLIQLTAPSNSIPPTALDRSDFSQGRFARYALSRGDILTNSNTATSLAPLTANLPSNYVAASFKADPSAAAGGNVQTGDYIDLYVVNTNSDTAPSHMFLQHVKVLSAAQDLDSQTSTSDSSSGSGGSSSGGSSSGSSSSNSSSSSASVVPFLFTVGVSPTDAAKIFTASQDQQYTIYVTLSSADTDNNKVNPVDVGAAASDILGGNATDAGIGTAETNTADADTPDLREGALRAEVQRVVGIVSAYAQTNGPDATVQDALTASGYKVPDDKLPGSKTQNIYNISASGTASNFTVSGSAITDNKGKSVYSYDYKSDDGRFTENLGQ